MRKLHQGLVAGAVGLAVLVPTGLAVAATPPTNPDPVCTEDQRAERWAVRDQLRAEILAQLQEEGVTDPDQLRDQLRDRLHQAMEDRFGELGGPQAGGGMGSGGMGSGGMGPGGMGPGGRQLGPMDGTGYGRGANR